jgi:PAS domain S-box-containing protein
MKSSILPESPFNAEQHHLSPKQGQIGFISVDRKWTILYCSSNSENARATKGVNFWKCFPVSKNSRFYMEYDRAITENIPVNFEEYSTALNAWFEIFAYPTPEGLSIHYKNITEKKKQEEEQKRNEQRLHKAQNDLQHVLESMTDGFYTVDRNWNITFATDKVAAMLGVNKEDYLGKNLWDCFPEARHTKVYTEYQRAFSENRPVSFEEYLATYNMWFEINAYPLNDLLAVYVKDITQRKNDEKRLEFIARATSEVIWELDLLTKETVINEEKFHEVFGYRLSPEFCHHSFWLEKLHPEDACAVTQKYLLALEQGLDYFMNEYRFKKSDGLWAYVKDRVYVVKDAHNKPSKLIGAMEDVTSERMAEKALFESEQTYKQLFDNSSLPKLVYDRDSLQILNVNQAATNQYGYSRKEFWNMTLLDIRPAEDHLRIVEAIKKAPVVTSTNSGVWTHIKKCGERMLVEVSIARIIYQGKECNLATVHDVTEKLRLQEQLTKEKVGRQQSITKAALEAQEKERTELGRELHDGINQVLTTAKLYVENIKYYPEQKDAFVDKSIDLIQKSIHEIRVLSKTLVSPAITESGFTEALEEMIQCYREVSLFKIKRTLSPEADKVEEALKLTIYRIIQEQLNNIVKYAKASQVTVQVQLKKQKLFVVIKDNGVGFEPCQRKSGLGLGNIKNRAELFNGKASIESAPGKGCKLEIIFPVDKNNS